MENISNIGLWVAYALIAAAVLSIVISAVVRILKQPSSAKSFLVGLLGLGVVILISYFISDGSDVNTLYSDMNDLTEETSHTVGMALNSLYVLGGLAILSILYVELTRLFK